MSSTDNSDQGNAAVDPPARVITVSAHLPDGKDVTIRYTEAKVCGDGKRGVVFSAKMLGGLAGDSEGETTDIAIKKVLQDKRFKDQELQILRQISHPNIANLKAFFYANGDKEGDIYLNSVLEFVPETVYRACRHYAKLKQAMPMLQIKLYSYQMFRALAYIQPKGIYHGDVKPHNLLISPATGVLKLCDFGSANLVSDSEPQNEDIGSLYYQSPEHLFGATRFTTAVDIWSAGCVMAEMMLGQPLFPGESSPDQLVEIMKVLGTPSAEEIEKLNPKYKEHRLPNIKPHPFERVFRPRTPAVALDLLRAMLVYTPSDRLTASEAVAHECFNDLRVEGCKLPNGKNLPPLFDFTREELSIRPDLIGKLVPPHAAPALNAHGIDIDNFEPVPPAENPIDLGLKLFSGPEA